MLKSRWSNSDHDRVVSVCSFGLRALTHDRAIFLNNLSIRSPIPPHALPHIAGRNGTLSWRFVMAFCHGDLSWRFVTAICRGNPVSVGSSGNLFIIWYIYIYPIIIIIKPRWLLLRLLLPLLPSPSQIDPDPDRYRSRSIQIAICHARYCSAMSPDRIPIDTDPDHYMPSRTPRPTLQFLPAMAAWCMAFSCMSPSLPGFGAPLARAAIRGLFQPVQFSGCSSRCYYPPSIESIKDCCDSWAKTESLGNNCNEYDCVNEDAI